MKDYTLVFRCNERGGSRAGVSLTRVHPYSPQASDIQEESYQKEKKKQREGAAGGDDIMCTAAKMQPHKNKGLHSAPCHVTNTGSVRLFLDLWCLWMCLFQSCWLAFVIISILPIFHFSQCSHMLLNMSFAFVMWSAPLQFHT